MQPEDPHFIPASEIDGTALQSVWSAMLPAESELLGASLFGDLFVARESGEVDMLDLVAGELKQVADCVEEFEHDRKQPERREELLMQSLANAASARGIKLGAGECLAFRTPPMLGGQLQPDNLVPWNLVAYHIGLARLLHQIKDLPLGSEVVERRDAPDA